MAYVTGSVVGHKALLGVIQTFANQNGWQTMRYLTPADDEHELILMGTGLNGTDKIYVGFRTSTNLTALTFNIQLNGFTGYNPDLNFWGQPGALPNSSYQSWLHSSNVNIVYWLAGNSRHLRLVCRLDNRYASAYLGLFLPFTMPSQYPYPLFIGGSGVADNLPAVSTNHSFFKEFGSGYFYNFGVWSAVSNERNKYQITGSGTGSVTSAYLYAVGWLHEYLVKMLQYKISKNFFALEEDGSRFMFPLVLCGSNAKGTASSTPKGFLGRLEGICPTTGYAANQEDIITYNGKNYLLISDITDTYYDCFIAFELF